MAFPTTPTNGQQYTVNGTTYQWNNSNGTWDKVGTTTAVPTAIFNGNSNVTVAANSNVTVSVAGNANVLTVTGTGIVSNLTGNLTGNVNGDVVGNLTGTASSAINAETVTIAAQPNITSLGTLTSLSLSSPLTAANGGTGLSFPGTSGNILTSNGTDWTSAAAPAGGFSNWQVFTSSGTFTVPTGITKVKVTVVGGGGGGNTNWYYAGGGGGGAAIKIITGLTPGATISVTVGAGGAQNTDGGTSSFGAYCSATGGKKGTTSTNMSGAEGGIGTGGDLNIRGGGSGGGVSTSGSITVPSPGGSSILGGGGFSSGTTAGVNGGDGGNYGGGGGGTGTASAGTGGNGVVIVEY